MSAPTQPRGNEVPSGLETEPIVMFHPTLVGTVNPGTEQPIPGVVLDEEPAVWPTFG